MKSTKKTKSKKIQYAAKDLLPADAFNERETKFRVSMYLDLDLLEEIRKRAKSKGIPYQTYINMYLRETHLGSSEEEKIRVIAREEVQKEIQALKLAI